MIPKISSSSVSSSSSVYTQSSSSSSSSSSVDAQSSSFSSEPKRRLKFLDFFNDRFRSSARSFVPRSEIFRDLMISDLLVDLNGMYISPGAEKIKYLAEKSFTKIRIKRPSNLTLLSRSFIDPEVEYDGKKLESGNVEDDFNILQQESEKHPVDPRLIGSSYVNNYPRNREKAQLNCDAFWCGTFLNSGLTLCIVADGCGLGSEPRMAAQHVVSIIKKNIIEYLPQSTTLLELAKAMIVAFEEAHSKLTENTDYSDRLTTVTVSVTFPAKKDKHYLFVTSLGDCKSYLCLRRPEGSACVVDLLQKQRLTFNMSDAGGVLGGVYFTRSGYNKLFNIPDLRNFSMVACEIPSGDWFVCSASDGLVDNLDPMALNIRPIDINPNIPLRWEDVDDGLKRKLIAEYSTTKLAGILGDSLSPDANLDVISRRVTDYTSAITKEIRERLEEHPEIDIREARDYDGKMDHTSVVIFRVNQQRGMAIPGSSSSSMYASSSSSSIP